MPDAADKVREAHALIARGELARARSVLQRALRHSPADPDANATFAELLTTEGDLPAALFYARRAAESRAAAPRHWTVLGHILCSTGDPASGAEWLSKSCAAAPDAVASWELLARAWLLQERFEDALAAATDGLARHPASPRLHQAHAQALLNLARSADAIASLRRGLAAAPGHVELLSSLAIALLYRDDADDAEVLAAHRAHAAALESAVRLQRPARPAPPRWSGNAPFRLAFISPDFRTHSVAFFIEPLLRHLDRTRVHVTCFSTCPKSDDTTARLRALADAWHDVATLSPLDTADRIRAAGIHVLVDLCGLMAGQRLTVLAMRPAAVQINYLGYPASLGMSCVDARLADDATDPPGAEPLHTERLVRLPPCFLAYQPPADAPALRTARPPGPFRFGSFNALQKISEACARLWAATLDRVPGSVLILKPGRDSQRGSRETLVRRLAAAGLAPERVRFLDRTAGIPDHLRQYDHVDLALDTFPYHGTTTTCEALHMGVPVVTRLGRAHRARVGASLLRAVGLSDLAAATDEAFVSAAASLAADALRLDQLRGDGPAGLRARLGASALGDHAAHATRFTDAVERLAKGLDAGPASGP